MSLLYKDNPVALSIIRHLDRFSDATDQKAADLFDQIKETRYTYLNHAGERLGIGRPTRYEYSVDADGGITLALFFTNRASPIWHTDHELRPSELMEIEPIHRYGYSIAKSSSKPMLFDGRYVDASGQVIYTSSECDKIAGFKVAHREKEVRFVE